QKSTNTGVSLLNTSASKFESENSNAIIISLFLNTKIQPIPYFDYKHSQ
ncbi:MAG: hypothetical protein ACI9M3_001514, partial [Bacteroidia bacterium]